MTKHHVKVIYLIKVVSDPIKLQLIHLSLPCPNKPKRLSSFRARDFLQLARLIQTLPRPSPSDYLVCNESIS